MKVKVTFEGNIKAGETLATGIGKSIKVLTHDENGNPYYMSVAKSWCTPVIVDEPAEHGPYKLRNEHGVFYAHKKRYSNYWLLFGNTRNYTWEDFGNVIEVVKLESDES